MGNMLDITVACALLAMTAGQASAGQKPAAPHAGEEVVVTQSASGQELRGRLVDLSPTSLAMLVDGRRVDVPIDNVLRIDVRNDSLKNGAIIGASVMAGLTAIGCAEIQAASQCAAGMVFNVGFGALLGAGIDALHKGRTPIYVKADRSGAGFGVRLRF